MEDQLWLKKNFDNYKALQRSSFGLDSDEKMSQFGVSTAPALHLLATSHLSKLRLSRLAWFTVTHLHKLSIASTIQPPGGNYPTRLHTLPTPKE